jgi:Icc-related predicted phosphoesterase
MKLVCFSDIHRHTQYVDSLPDGDVLIFSGDEDIRSFEDLMKFITWFIGFHHKHKIWIAGNHDLYLEGNYDLVKRLSNEAGIIYLENEEVTIDGVRFYGSPITPRFFDWAFMRDRGDEISKVWEKIPEGIDVLITHGPALNKLDVSGRGDVCGCYDLGSFIKKIKPKVHICGHIHGSYGYLKEDNITYINCSLLNEHYQLVNDAIVYDTNLEEILT